MSEWVFVVDCWLGGSGSTVTLLGPGSGWLLGFWETWKLRDSSGGRLHVGSGDA